MRVIVDTNVLISAAIADGNPENVIDFIVANDNYKIVGWVKRSATQQIKIFV